MTTFESTMNEVKAELLRFGGPDAIGLYLTIIEEGANRVSQASAPENVQKHKDILNELNRLYRKLERSRVTEKKIHKELSNLSDDAQTFVRVELTLQLQRSVDLASEDWSNVASQSALKQSVQNARKWVRQFPGGKPATQAHVFCRDVMRVYQQIANKTPGVGGELSVTAFERLWHASLCLIDLNATILQAREIYRRASFRR
jgi:hypothetical protein